MIISHQSFEKLKPWYVRPSTTRDTRLCRYHVEFDLYFHTFKSFRVSIGSNVHVPNNAHELLMYLLCEREEGEIFFKMACVQGVCQFCGNISRWVDCNDDISVSLIMKWRRDEYVSKDLLSGGQSKRIDLVESDIPVAQFMDKFKHDQIYKYIKHTHIYKWKDHQFRSALDTFPIGTSISVVDFLENYILAAQTEIQSEYYFSDQVTIFVHIVYRHAVEEVDGVSSTLDHCVVIKETLFYFSDDTQHDTHFVQHCFHKFFESLVQ